MPARFSRLRIAGFKSFAEAVAVDILPGLTGIVGPNGCGKSNVVDALRWVMGESSAKSMRGGEMDDVVFAGTFGRTARNVAEVVVTLEETADLAPAAFGSANSLEIGRRIERGSGSTYRVNGREVRARDVATLFADLASGARSSALVSQGRVATLINARPEDRRLILEEAAGITGLHARRHEADLKLRSAEQNLLRADDLKADQEGRLEELRKQARQANRYRTLSGAIRDAEAEYLASEAARAQKDLTAAEAMVKAAKQRADAASHAVAAAQCAEREADAALPACRAAASEARTALERARIAAEQAEADIARRHAERAEAAGRVETLRRDLAHAQKLSDDGRAALDRLSAERTRLESELDSGPAEIDAADAEAADSERLAAAASREVEAATEQVAHLSAAIEAARSRLTAASDAVARARARHASAIADHERAEAALIAPARLDAASEKSRIAGQDAAAAVSQVESARTAAESADAIRDEAEAAARQARDAATTADAAVTRLRAETDALRALVGQRFGRDPKPVIELIAVPGGLETALGAALGDDLAAGTEAAAASNTHWFWRGLPEAAAGALAIEGRPLTSLAAEVEAPQALHRALAHIFVLPEDMNGDAVQQVLAPGQILVARDGRCWRWDGLTVRGGKPNEAAARLAQRNRLKDLESQLTAATAVAAQHRATREAALEAERQANCGLEEARTQRRSAERRADETRSAAGRAAAAEQQLRHEAARLALQAESLAETRARLDSEAADADAALAAAERDHAALPDAKSARETLDRARAEVSEHRKGEQTARNRAARLRSAADQRARRLQSIGREVADWSERSRDSAERVIDLAARLSDAERGLAALDDRPDSGALLARSRDEKRRASVVHEEAATALAEAEDRARESAARARDAESQSAAAREATLGTEAACAQAAQIVSQVAERIAERLGPEPVLPAITDPSEAATEKARRRFERLTRERDEMGPVNLRAEIEVAEIEARLAAIERDREDIGSAIAKLRASIGQINREGRNRLSAVFDAVDRQFRALFARMFEGGRAHLALIGSDDPLEAGLEIFAEPPGKRLAKLSLLSGGEQALTALSLIFAVFNSNPAPLAVLDEVDAPLDDANVERFCRLLEDICRETGTRMLVVTHHHLTMARMDRLYGVTMEERGVSRLLSVDLQRAAAMAADALQAVAAE